jgi:hypothetical protein
MRCRTGAKTFAAIVKTLQRFNEFSDKLNPAGWALKFTADGLGMIKNGAGKIFGRIVDNNFTAKALKDGVIIDVPKTAMKDVALDVNTEGKLVAKINNEDYELVEEGTESVVQEVNDLITKRTNWLNDLKSHYGSFDIKNFKPQGLNNSDIPSSTYSEMLSEYSNTIDNITKQGYLDDLIKTGSTIPDKKVFSLDEELYKVVPENEGVTPYTPFFITKSQLDALANVTDIENELGLPLVSHAVKYDVYKITATQEAEAFESTIANTIESKYTTTGGAKQILVIDRSKWSKPLKINTITPNK